MYNSARRMPRLQHAGLHVSVAYNTNKEVSVAGIVVSIRVTHNKNKIIHQYNETIIVTLFSDAVSATLVCDMGI
jgi:hypothetical protein